jgi:hypothetical protein
MKEYCNKFYNISQKDTETEDGLGKKEYVFEVGTGLTACNMT